MLLFTCPTGANKAVPEPEVTARTKATSDAPRLLLLDIDAFVGAVGIGVGAGAAAATIIRLL